MTVYNGPEMTLKTIALLLLLPALMLLLVSCGRGSQTANTPTLATTATPTAAPTVDIDAIVEAKVKERIAAIPTPTPKVVVVEKEVPVEKIVTVVVTATPIPTPTPEPVPTAMPEPVATPTPMVAPAATAAPTAATAAAGGYQVEASDFAKEFEDNAVVATEKYKGEMVTVTGTIETIDFDFMGDPYISVTGGGMFELNSVWCMINDASQSTGLSSGDNVTVIGTFKEWELWIGTLDNCSVK